MSGCEAPLRAFPFCSSPCSNASFRILTFIMLVMPWAGMVLLGLGRKGAFQFTFPSGSFSKWEAGCLLSFQQQVFANAGSLCTTTVITTVSCPFFCSVPLFSPWHWHVCIGHLSSTALREGSLLWIVLSGPHLLLLSLGPVSLPAPWRSLHPLGRSSGLAVCDVRGMRAAPHQRPG